MYIMRHMEKTLAKLGRMFGAILITGARQVGKTTLLKNTKPDIAYITLDDPIVRLSAIEEPATFFKITPPPVIIDEIQYAPDLFPYIKMKCDRDKLKGQFYMSGSQQFKVMKNVTESLAGRVGIASLHGLSLREINGVKFSKPFIPTEEYFNERKLELTKNNYNEIWNIIHKGSMPEMYSADTDWQLFYSSYTSAYIERDIRDLTQVGDEMKFLKFITAVAATTGQLLNLASLARDVGISQPTAERWLSILKASNIIYLLQPYHNNITKRALKTPKVYFLDTGLAAYLTRWSSPEVLQKGAMAGAFFETFVISEIIKSYANSGIAEAPLYFYRDKEQNEIALMIYQDMTLYPIEIKKTADPDRNIVNAFKILDKIAGVTRGQGGVVCMSDSLLPAGDNNMMIPLAYI